jgi:hypothetical protein
MKKLTLLFLLIASPLFAQSGYIANWPFTLTDPGANTVLGWDDTDNRITNFTLGAGMSYNHATHTVDSTAAGTNTKLRVITATIDGGGSAITAGKVKGFYTVPYSGTITGWSFVVDAGTATVKTWKKATGTAKPTTSDSINTSGVSISTGTAVRSATVTDFTTTTVTAGDIFAFNLTAVSTATELTFQLEITTN